MSKEVSIFTQGGKPARTRELSPLAKSLASSGIVSRRIQTNTNGTFKRIINGEQIGNAIRGEIDLIIVNALPEVSRVYYKEKYDPDAEHTLPNCWSNMGDFPEEGASDKQHSNCKECPQNIAGSGDKGSKACRFQRRIAVLVAGDASGEIYQFNIPAKSLFGKGSGNVHPFESYVKYLIHNGASPDNVVTHVEYDLDADTMELEFSPLRSITDEEYDMVVAAQASPESSMYVKLTAAQTDKVTKLPPKSEDDKSVKTTKKPKIQRAEEPDEEEEDDAEPVVRKSKTTKSADTTRASSLDAVIADWANE